MEQTFQADSAALGQRLDRFLAANLACSRSKVRAAIESGHCSINGNVWYKPDLKLTGTSLISIEMPDQPSELQAEKGEVVVLYQDPDLIVVNKPPYLTVHPCPSQPANTLIQRLIRLFPELTAMSGPRPGIVHRIDKDTSGLLLIARTETVRLKLSQMFAERQIHKEYLALVHGVPETMGECRAPIGRHPTIKTRMAVVQGGRSAETHWQRLWVSPDAKISLLRVMIATGRTHQIRVHLSHLGFPLLGDTVYGSSQTTLRQMLHATKLDFVHPTTGQPLHFVCPPPEDFITQATEHIPLLQKVVITGNPASGKSKLTQYFASRGYPTFSADLEVAKIYAEKNGLRAWLAGHGGQHLVSDLGIDRQKLMQAMEEDPLFKRDLEAMLHSAVHARLQTFWQQTKANCAIAEIPLWFECGFKDSVLTVCVTAPREIRFARAAQHRSWSAAKAATIESWQWDAERKAKASDLVLENSGDIASFEQKAHDCEERLAQLRTRQDEQHRARLLSAIESVR